MNALPKPKPQPHVSVDDYLAAELSSDIKHEYLGGQVVAMGGASDRHGLLTTSLSALLLPHARRKACQVFTNDMKVRLNHDGESTPIAVQIAGADPDMMAEAAVFNIQKGAQIIDINMGCPVKKVCNVASGSALLRDEALVARILERVVQACQPFNVPVTLKTRTGWDTRSRNALRIGQLAQDTGIPAT